MSLRHHQQHQHGQVRSDYYYCARGCQLDVILVVLVLIVDCTVNTFNVLA